MTYNYSKLNGLLAACIIAIEAYSMGMRDAAQYIILSQVAIKVGSIVTAVVEHIMVIDYDIGEAQHYAFDQQHFLYIDQHLAFAATDNGFTLAMRSWDKLESLTEYVKSSFHQKGTCNCCQVMN